jgi:hypothetical protein
MVHVSHPWAITANSKHIDNVGFGFYTLQSLRLLAQLVTAVRVQLAFVDDDGGDSGKIQRRRALTIYRSMHSAACAKA